jgi:C_GCAxxG_C_C family probable redox protein
MEVKSMTEKQLKAIENAQRYFNSGFNCSESSALALTEYLEIVEKDPIIPKIATGLAGGVGRSGTSHCGIFIATVMAIGMKYGRDDAKDKQAIQTVYKKVQSYWDRFEKEFGSRDCIVITGFDLGPPDGIKKWAAAGGREKCTALMAKAFQVAYEYL